MQFAIMVWTSQSVARANTIFGVIEHESAAQLPQLPNGHWANFRVPIDERRFKFAQDAKKAIEGHGYYLFGASATEAFEG
jgi:hypothetical protein